MYMYINVYALYPLEHAYLPSHIKHMSLTNIYVLAFLEL